MKKEQYYAKALDTETGVTTATLFYKHKPSINLYDGEECIASYENDKEFIEDYKRMKQENKNLRETIKNNDLTINKLCANNKHYKHIIDELEKWLEDEKDRLARECSQIYEDSLGKTKLVNEDIFNFANKTLNKLQELKGSDEE